jgi:hypothetical protein
MIWTQCRVVLPLLLGVWCAGCSLWPSASFCPDPERRLVLQQRRAGPFLRVKLLGRFHPRPYSASNYVLIGRYMGLDNPHWCLPSGPGPEWTR